MAKRVGARSEEWWVNQPAHVLRCTGKKPSTGERCRREAIPGGTVCRIHGGALPAVQQAAATRIGMTADAAISELVRIMEDPEADDRNKIAVARDLLDRAGLGATNKLLVGIGHVDPVERLFMDILSDPNGLADPTNTARPALPASSAHQGEGEDSPLLRWETDVSGFDDVVDAELVEDSPAQARPHQHTVHIGEAPKTPKHIREALERLL